MPSITSRRSVEELQNGTVKESAHNPRRLQGKMEIGGRDQEDAAAGLHQHSPDRCSTMESLANGGKVRDCRRAQDANNDGLGIEIAAENGAEEVVVDKEGTRIYRRVSVESQEVLSPLSCNAALSNGGNSLLDVQKKLSENAGENTALTSATRPSERTTVQIENPTVDHEITISTATATTTGSATATGTSTESPLRAPIDSPSPRPRRDHTLKLSPAKIHELTSAPDSLCLHKVPTNTEDKELSSALDDQNNTLQEVWQDGEDGELFNHDRRNLKMGLAINGTTGNSGASGRRENGNVRRRKSGNLKHVYYEQQPLELPGHSPQRYHASGRQRPQLARGSTTPGGPSRRLQSPFQADWQTAGKTSKSRPERRVPGRLNLEEAVKSNQAPSDLPSPIPASIPLPPFSLSTYLQLELSSSRPSPLYIHQSRTKDFPYESSRVKLERLLNFLLLPPSLEQVLFFGTLACLDSWLYTFTILPLRFFKSLFILFQSWIVNLGLEAQYISSFIVQGVGRVWKRKQRGYSVDKKVEQTGDNAARAATNVPSAANNDPFLEQDSNSRADANQRRLNRHRRTKSVPSGLQPDDKADILKGLLMIFTCAILLYFDASRMYHWIRGQAAIKLYVIYNVLEVSDRLFSAIGQDVLECLFSREALERKPDGRSKILRPFWLFILALFYTVIHATALFYQVMTLNVAVNSYSNALITLLLSNQFVEIKSAVFKKFEKENLFQLTCADVVERFQLWLMLMIIASRNFVETGAVTFGNALAPFSRAAPTPSTNSTPPVSPPQSATSILPQSFTLLSSSFFASLSSAHSFLPTIGHVLGPFLVVLGSEMLVDWLKHAYINKFNNTRPSIYGRFLDILTKDYYTNAFGDQNLNRRLGLPVIPLSCLFFRVSIQTYQMFLAAWLPQPPSLTTSSNSTSLSSIHTHYSTSSTATLPAPFSLPTSLSQISTVVQSLFSRAMPSPSAFIPTFTIILVLLLYVTLLLIKLVLGMILLSYSRARYKRMKIREREMLHQHQKQPQVQPQVLSASIPTKDAQLPSPPPETAPPPSPIRPNAKKDVAINDTVEGSRRVGGWGTVEVGGDRRRWIYADDPEGLRRLKERDERDSKKSGKTGGGLHGIEHVRRYEMVAKRIW